MLEIYLDELPGLQHRNKIVQINPYKFQYVASEKNNEIVHPLPGMLFLLSADANKKLIH